MALGNIGDIVTYVSVIGGNTTHYGVVVGTTYDSSGVATKNTVATKLGVSSRDRIEWQREEDTTAVTVLSSTDALHG
jgi:hypothetical protein